jgi:hypothetical protein
MAYCSNCKSVVHRTTKICPSCGGDLSKLFGPKALWGKPPKETVEGKSEDKITASDRAELTRHQAYIDSYPKKVIPDWLPEKAQAKIREKLYEKAISARLKREDAQSTEKARKATSNTRLGILFLIFVALCFVVAALN